MEFKIGQRVKLNIVGEHYDPEIQKWHGRTGTVVDSSSSTLVVVRMDEALHYESTVRVGAGGEGRFSKYELRPALAPPAFTSPEEAEAWLEAQS